MVLIKVNTPVLTDDFTRMINFYRKNPVIAANHLLKRDGEPLTLAPIQEVILGEWWNSKFSLLTASRGTGKTFLSAVYASLRGLLYPGTRAGVFAPAFRQSKLIFKEFTTLYEDSPILQECVEKEPVQLNDQCVCLFKPAGRASTGSFVKAFPIGSDGAKIRGERLSCLNYSSFLLTNQGLLNIGDVVLDKLSSSISTPSNGFQTNINLIVNEPEELLRINTYNGYSIEATPDHQLLSSGSLKRTGDFNIGNPIDIYAKDIYPENITYVPAVYDIESKNLLRFGVGKYLTKYPNYLNEEIAELLGFIVAEGACNDRTRIEIAQKDRGML